MSSGQHAIGLGPTTLTVARDTGSRSLDRFRDIKRVMQDRHAKDLEVTNEMVLSTLCDIYWLHAENIEGEEVCNEIAGGSGE